MVTQFLSQSNYYKMHGLETIGVWRCLKKIGTFWVTFKFFTNTIIIVTVKVHHQYILNIMQSMFVSNRVRKGLKISIFLFIA